MSSRTSATSVTIVKQKNGSIPSVLINSSMGTSKQPTLSKNMSASTKGLKSNKNTHPSKQEQQQQQQQQEQQQEHQPPKQKSNNLNVTKNPPQQRRTVLSVKARRVERRKEIVSMTEAIKIDLDTTSSTESDDSTSSSSSSSSSSCGKKNNDQIHKRHSNMIHATTSTTILSAEIAKKREYQQRNRRRSSSVSDIRNSHVYAGPTFNNAPAPSALPIPAFSPTLLSVNLIATNATDGKDDLKRHSQDLMNLLSPKPHHREFDSDLSEIQRGLRSMLKI